MAEPKPTGISSYSVPSSPVTDKVIVEPFLNQTPIPSMQKGSEQWVQGAPTPIKDGQLTPMTEALNLLIGFSTGEIMMDGDDVKHLPTISESLNSIWETPKKKTIDGSVNRTKKAKIAQKEPRKNISRDLAI